jgi:TolB protein
MGTAIKAVNADGSGLETLVDLPGTASNPQWSPDGSKIAYLRRLPSCGWPCVIAVVDSVGNPIFEMHDFKDTAEFHLIWPVVWSPDGSRLAFSVRWYPIDRIYMIDSDGTGLTQVTDGRSDLESYIIGSWVP